MHVRRDRFVAAHLAVTMATLFVFVVLERFSYELFFIVSFFGFLILAVVTMPYRVMAPWQRRIRWVVLSGFVVFAYIVVNRLLTVVGWEIA